jgi:hypothetical protein
MQCQRCKVERATSSSQMKCMSQTPGVYTVREVRLCSRCKGQDWPTMDIDAPMVTVVDSVELKWKETREFQESIGSFENIPPDDRVHFRHMLRLMARALVDVSEGTSTGLPPDAAHFVHEQLGDPPYPTVLDLWMQNPDFKAQFETQQLKR